MFSPQASQLTWIGFELGTGELGFGPEMWIVETGLRRRRMLIVGCQMVSDGADQIGSGCSSGWDQGTCPINNSRHDHGGVGRQYSHPQ